MSTSSPSRKLTSLFRTRRGARTTQSLTRIGTGVAQPRPGILTLEELRERAAKLAQTHRSDSRRSYDRLLQRLDGNEKLLQESYDTMTAAVRAGRPIAPAGEWLLDNFYLIKERIRSARRNLPRAYCRELPALADGKSAGLPRVYDIALELISCVEGRVDIDNLKAFIDGYESVRALKLGELWCNSHHVAHRAYR